MCVCVRVCLQTFLSICLPSSFYALNRIRIRNFNKKCCIGIHHCINFIIWFSIFFSFATNRFSMHLANYLSRKKKKLIRDYLKSSFFSNTTVEIMPIWMISQALMVDLSTSSKVPKSCNFKYWSKIYESIDDNYFGLTILIDATQKNWTFRHIQWKYLKNNNVKQVTVDWCETLLFIEINFNWNS